MKRYIKSAILPISDEDVVSRMTIATNTDDAEILRELSKDPEPNVRINVADNENTPEDVLRELATDDWVDFAVARNPNTPIDVLETLMESEDSSVRRSVAENLSTPVSWLYNLERHDVSDEVRQAAWDNPNYDHNRYGWKFKG
jgi:hypothetical protein